MRYSKLMILIFFTTFLFIRCETDDYCEEEVLTPRLIVRFYDHLGDTIRPAKHLYVWAEGKDTLYNDKTTDSLALPLNTSTHITKYLLSVNNQSDSIWTDTLKISYLKNNIYVSRSCGYKTVFSLENLQYNTSWLHQVSTFKTPQSVENESAAHIKIKH